MKEYEPTSFSNNGVIVILIKFVGSVNNNISNCIFIFKMWNI